MSKRATIKIRLTREATRVLMTDRCGGEILKAQLPASSAAHPCAARTLLEGLALFCGDRLRIVLSAESEDFSCAQGLSDGLGFGIDTLYYEVDIVPSKEVGRRGQGSFHDVRRLRAIERDAS
jgi:hypothetical protein